MMRIINMSNKTLIFLSGFAVPNWLSKSHFVWDDYFWKDYQRIYIPSKTPISDNMVSRELDNLSNIINKYNNPVVIGQSLGGWWAANLGCQPNVNINKLVLWTPVCHADYYPIFNITKRHNPLLKTNAIQGPHKVLISYAYNDWLVPYEQHALPLLNKFGGMIYRLNGGHWLQKNHKFGLSFMKEWIEL